MMIVVSLSVTAWLAHAVTLRLPQIPKPKFTVGEVLKKLEDHAIAKGAQSQMLLVAVEWCHADQFTPRLRDGSSYHILQAKDEWSWFITYVVRRDGSKDYTDVSVFCVRDTGEISPLPSTRP